MLTKALFLDRDGTLNEDSGYVGRKEDFVFIRGAKKAVIHPGEIAPPKREREGRILGKLGMAVSGIERRCVVLSQPQGKLEVARARDVATPDGCLLHITQH